MSRRSRPTLVVRGEPLKKTRSVGFQFPDFPLDFLLDYGANPSEYKLSGLSTAEDEGCDQMGEDRVRTDDGSKELFVMNKETGEDSLSSELADFGGASYHCDEGSYLRLASSVVLEDGDKMTEDSNVDKMGEDSYTSQLSGGDEDSGDLDSEMGGYPDSLHSTDSETSDSINDDSEQSELDDEETEETKQSEHIKPSHQQMRGDGPEATNIAAGRVEYFPGYSPTGGKLEATQIVRSPNKKLPVPMAANFIKKNYVDYDNLQIQQGIVIDWACIDFSSMHSRLHRFFYKLAAVCEGIGMHFSCAPVKTFHVKSITPDNIGRTFQDVCNSILEILSRIQMKGEPIGLLLVILPHNRAFDAKIEEACENLRVVYQCCLPCDIYKPTKQYLKGTARAIKSKVVERDAFIPFVSEGPTIILGADTSCDTVASVGTSVDWQEFRDYKTVVEPNNGLVIQQLGRMICRDRKAYRNISMVPPAYAAWSQAQKCFPATPSSSVW